VTIDARGRRMGYSGSASVASVAIGGPGSLRREEDPMTRRAGVAAAAVHLADDDVRRRGERRRSTAQQCCRHNEREHESLHCGLPLELPDGRRDHDVRGVTPQPL
jgi:hypothetical protein